MNTALGRIDQILENYLNRRKLSHTLRLMMRSGYDLSVVYDVGANKGRWTKQMKRVMPDSDFFMFEANEAHCEKLKSRGVPYFIEVLGAQEETRDFYAINGTGDSLFQEKTKHYNEDTKRQVNTKKLSSIVEANQLPKPNFIKLDVQGAEIEILKGAHGIMDKCQIVFMECPLLEYNKGAPKLHEYIDYMASIGFTPLHILEQHIIEGVLTQFDIVFIKQKS